MQVYSQYSQFSPTFPEAKNEPKEDPHREDIKARNRIAAKKWRDKKDSLLYQLEAKNDELRKTALSLRTTSLSLQTEISVLEDELRFFQTFMTKIMNSSQPN